MSTVQLTFNLPEESNDAELAVKALDMSVVIFELDQWLRSKVKYGHDFKTADEALEKTRDELRSLADGLWQAIEQ